MELVNLLLCSGTDYSTTGPMSLLVARPLVWSVLGLPPSCQDGISWLTPLGQIRVAEERTHVTAVETTKQLVYMGPNIDIYVCPLHWNEPVRSLARPTI